MLLDDIRRVPPKVLTEDQREFYFENGYLLLEKIISDEWLDLLQAATADMVEASRKLQKSDKVLELEPGHTAADPRLRRITSPVDHHPTYWRFASASVIVDIAADLAGPDIKFHHSKLNFKWARGGTEVKWHQDIQYWPHTNYSSLTFGTYLQDCGDNQAPLGVLPRSHNGVLYDHYDEQDVWTGALTKADMAVLPVEQAVYLPGPAGSVTIHNCRTLHCSGRNEAVEGRPLLLNTYSAANSMPYTANPIPSAHAGEIVRGKPARWAWHDPRPCPMPPDWSGGTYTSIFSYQQREAQRA